MPTLRTLSVTFNLPLKSGDLEAFRGAMIGFAGGDNDLWHNHDNSQNGKETAPEGAGKGKGKFMHRFPLIQYSIHEGRASLFGIGDGAEAIDKVLRTKTLKNFCMNGHPLPLEVSQRLENGSFPLALTTKKEGSHSYRIYHYVPLTPENYAEYKGLPDFVAKVQLLERLLANHLVAFAHGVGWEFAKNRRLEVSIQDIDRVKKVDVLGTDMMAFDLVFSANALLPDRLGIGRKAAFGFGWFYRLPPPQTRNNRNGAEKNDL